MQFDELRAQCESCTRCGLCQGRTNVVFGMGNPASPVMFVGEGPGQHEDEQGLPFVGRSGQLLDLYLDVIDLDRSKVRVVVSMFGRETPVELELDQVEPVQD